MKPIYSVTLHRIPGYKTQRQDPRQYGNYRNGQATIKQNPDATMIGQTAVATLGNGSGQRQRVG